MCSSLETSCFATHITVLFVSVLFTADIISTVEFNYSGDLLATGDKGGRVVIFQREQEVSDLKNKSAVTPLFLCCTVSLHLSVL